MMKKKVLITAFAILALIIPLRQWIIDDIIIQMLSDDEYCEERVRDVYPDFTFATLEPPIRVSTLDEDLRDMIRHRARESAQLPVPTFVRFFLIYQFDPEVIPMGENNHFYVGVMFPDGDVIELAFDELFY